MHKISSKDKCELCQKFIYTHDIVLCCNLDSKIYHSKCLKIDNDVALELQNSPDWYCPCCLKSIFPYFDLNNTSVEINSCQCCKKIISNKRDKVIDCRSCQKKCHYNCIRKPLFICNFCEHRRSLNFSESSNDLNIEFRDTCFNPFNFFENDDDDKKYFFDDDVSDYCETTELAAKVLNKCKYYEPSELKSSAFLGTSFFFNNIDGFQSNFVEFKNQLLNCDCNFDFYCFNETNLKKGRSHDFEMNNYVSKFLYSIDDKAKGSGLAIYYRNNLKFTINN